MRSIVHCLVLTAIVLCCSALAYSSDPEYQPKIEPSSNEGKQAIESFRIPEGMQVELAAAEPNVANPVAFAFDEQGRIFVCETFRQKQGVEDNRGHMYWLEDDLQAQTVADRRQYMLKNHPEMLSAWTAQHDRIRLLEDENRDGTYETAYVYADGFNDLVTGTGAGILEFDGDVYYTCIPRLWKFEDTNGDGRADEREILQDGFGVRFAFRGHDMHGLTLGPDGRIYFSIGDRGYNLITEDGRVLKRPDTGAVFRCERDGSNLEEFAYGLRNPQELAFDNDGNLFTGDNNSDSGDKARWVYVAEGSDSGWRMYYQYLSDRGPWNRERIWYPFQADEETTAVQPAYTLPPIANLGDGPSGLVSYYGVGLPDRYQGHFFLADFRGQASNSGIRSFANKAKGAGFELVDSHEYLWNTLVTDVDFGYDGRLYFSDWVNGWDGIQKGRIYRQQPVEDSLKQPGNEVARIFQKKFADRSAEELTAMLSHADRRVRQRAQIEMATRNAHEELVVVAIHSDDLKARKHAIWGLWEIARQPGKKNVLAKLIPLLQNQNPDIVAQVCRVFGDCRYQKASTEIQAALKHENPRVLYYAAIACGKLGIASAKDELLSLATTRGKEDPVLRHALVMGLTGIGAAQQSTEQAVELLDDPKAGTLDSRLAVVVALRRLRDSAISQFLNDAEPKVVIESARAIHDERIEVAMPALARYQGNLTFSEALARRVVNANYLLGQQENAETLVQIATNDRLSETVRQQAMTALLSWSSGSNIDAVIGKYRPRTGQSAPYLKEIVSGSLPDLFRASEKLQKQAVELAALLEISDIAPQMMEYVDDEKASVDLRVSALLALDQIATKKADPIVKRMISSELPELRKTARKIFATRHPAEAGPVLQAAIDEGTLAEQQDAIHQLARLDAKMTQQILADLLQKMLADQLPLGLHLDVIQAAETTQDQQLTGLVKSYNEKFEAGNPIEKFRVCLEGGNKTLGEELFFGNAAASCRRCHLVNGQGGGVGPDLSEIGKKNEAHYLLESIVDPNAKIAKGFETVLLVTIEGKIVSGIIKEETDDFITLVKPMGEIVQIAQDDIEDQAPGKSGMPADIANQMTKAQIRDLVAYLKTLTKKKNVEAHGIEE
ncbi:MAG TPA: glucose dehydrogenase [Planctomycetaceae bacterium]|nr:glucose dehydrogenase [Planctomycetaceae bacterium]